MNAINVFREHVIHLKSNIAEIETATIVQRIIENLTTSRN